MAGNKLSEGVTAEHVVQALADFDRSGAHPFGESTKYDLAYEGRRFPPKAIMALAVFRARGVTLTPKDFDGGQESTAFRVLRRLGFAVERKPNRGGSPKSWDLAPGESIRRRELHDRFGGSRQGGISPSRDTPNIMIFTDPDVGEQFGYFDGWKDDGCFHYTGEGQRGDMRMNHGNRAIAEHGSSGRTLRLFHGSSGVVLYDGEYAVDGEQPFYEGRAPDREGASRKSIVFRLRRVDGKAPANEGRAPAPRRMVATVPLEVGHVDRYQVRNETELKEASRHESTLVSRFAGWVEGGGGTVERLRILVPGEDSALYTDAFWVERSVLIEAKAAVSREALRMAVGQLLDYVRHVDPRPRLAVLLPAEPTGDLGEFLRSVGIAAIWSVPDGSFRHSLDREPQS